MLGKKSEWGKEGGKKLISMPFKFITWTLMRIMGRRPHRNL